jgi:SAM-dependent methyltransferase
MEGVPYAMWIAYLELLWSKCEAKPSDVLEVCCGTGKLCRALTTKGIRMTGIDLSQQMIDIAIKKADEENLEINFSCQDAAKLDLPWTFDAAFSFFDSMNYITQPDNCRSAIAATASHLRPGAPFIFDLNTAFAFEQRMFDQSDLKRDRKVRYKWVSQYDPQSRICRVDMSFWAGDRYFEEVHEQRAHSIEEVDEWMKEAGFTSVAFYDAYTLNRPKARSDRIHVVGIAS